MYLVHSLLMSRISWMSSEDLLSLKMEWDFMIMITAQSISVDVQDRAGRIPFIGIQIAKYQRHLSFTHTCS